MFHKTKSKDTEEEFANDVVDKEEDLDDPRGSSADEEEDENEEEEDSENDDPEDSSDDEEEDDEEDEDQPRGSSADEDEKDNEPEETETRASKKVSVTQESSSDENSDVEDTEMDDLFEPEGELAIDVYQTDSDIVIQSAIAGVKSDELDISVEDDIVTIRGMRKNPEQSEDKQYFHEECFWGPFSRQVFLPEEIDTKNVQASLKDGILTLRLPRTTDEKEKKVKLKKK